MTIPLRIEDAGTRATIRSVVQQVLQNAVPRIDLPEKLTLRFERKEHHIAVEWDGKVEAKIGGIEPDMLRMRMYDDHAKVDLRFSGIRVDYS